MQYFLVLAFCVFSSAVQAVEHPSASALTGLLKKQKDSKEVSAFVRTYSMSGGFKGDSGSFSSPDQAYVLIVRDDKICAISLRLQDWPEGSGEKHWKRYSQKVPAQLSAKEGRDEVVKKLGNPVENRNETWLHCGLYLWVHFDEAGESIEELWVSPQVIEADGG